MRWRVEIWPDTLRLMDECQAVDRVAKALHHLRGFRTKLYAGQIVDEESQLSADDLSVLIEVIDQLEAMQRQDVPAMQWSTLVKAAGQAMLSTRYTGLSTDPS